MSKKYTNIGYDEMQLSISKSPDSKYILIGSITLTGENEEKPNMPGHALVSFTVAFD